MGLGGVLDDDESALAPRGDQIERHEVSEQVHRQDGPGAIGPDGRDIPLRLDGEAAPVGTTRVLDVRKARQSFRFAGIDAPPTSARCARPTAMHFVVSPACCSENSQFESASLRRGQAASAFATACS